MELPLKITEDFTKKFNQKKKVWSMEQFIMGTAYTTMGLATMLFPLTVSGLSINKTFLPPKQLKENAPFKLAMQCFGAQATLCGILICSVPFDRVAYRNFGLAILPFFVFDLVAWRQGKLNLLGAYIDAIGNTIFCVCCYIGFMKASK